MREEHRLRVFKDRVQSKIFGPQREERQETGENCSSLLPKYSSVG
jgi:hypothetical protein